MNHDLTAPPRLQLRREGPAPCVLVLLLWRRGTSLRCNGHGVRRHNPSVQRSVALRRRPTVVRGAERFRRGRHTLQFSLNPNHAALQLVDIADFSPVGGKNNHRERACPVFRAKVEERNAVAAVFHADNRSSNTCLLAHMFAGFSDGHAVLRLG